MDGHLKFRGGREGVSKAKIFKGKYEAKLRCECKFSELWLFCCPKIFEQLPNGPKLKLPLHLWLSHDGESPLPSSY